METEALCRRVHMIQSGRPTVLALGGGAFGQTCNFELIENNGVSIWLDCPLPTIRRRLEGCTHRPLARDPIKLEILYYTRRDSYARADHHIEIAGDQPELVVEAVLKLPLF